MLREENNLYKKKKISEEENADDDDDCYDLERMKRIIRQGRKEGRK